MNLEFKNKTILVTGGSKGIGKAIAIAFAEEGANVIICGRGEEALKETSLEIEKMGGTVLAVQADLTKQTDVDHLISTAVDYYKTIDILVNNAGIASGFDHFESLDIDQWQHLFDVNLFGAVRVTKAVIPYMKKTGLGRIINISSESGIQPDAFMPHYNASKAALINFTKSLSKAYAADGILVNTVSPAFIMTPMLENLLKDNSAKLNISYEEAIQEFLKQNRPHVEVKRPGTVEEVASAVIYLASNKASFVNGVNLRVDGGSVASL
ncbi:SDR family NAD(P)-dependent oxidoreductase [Mesobacillus foraminis]|uniref:NAD(P)-dependent dehydrogenase (Short-subunit alcohol dehydrogenase family) n=1 Tax=Mesobacillus foraminis TaxID=279826 RepID=A0A4R2B5S7_9BACI|nr:SDR family oxidoreductase [Mesobacillus foraminis]TCN21182.1 NAD(P)-dependent dehydrogenase (short-subunit alcohol dehydrogenase family) [Mesobacillus foraminis]